MLTLIIHPSARSQPIVSVWIISLFQPFFNDFIKFQFILQDIPFLFIGVPPSKQFSKARFPYGKAKKNSFPKFHFFELIPKID